MDLQQTTAESASALSETVGRGERLREKSWEELERKGWEWLGGFLELPDAWMYYLAAKRWQAGTEVEWAKSYMEVTLASLPDEVFLDAIARHGGVFPEDLLLELLSPPSLQAKVSNLDVPQVKSYGFWVLLWGFCLAFLNRLRGIRA